MNANSENPHDYSFEEEVRKILIKASLFFPETKSQIEELEKGIDTESVAIPDNPLEILENSPPKLTRLYGSNFPPGEIEESMAIAAKGNGEITPELEEKMRKDRENAERGNSKKQK